MASKLTAVGLVSGAAGIVIKILTGADEYPIIARAPSSYRHVSPDVR